MNKYSKTCASSLLAFFLLVIFSSVLAQPQPGIFKRISNNTKGVSDMLVLDILQDREGFLWIATGKGLYRYDGHDMRVFRENPADTGSIGGGRTTVLAEDQDGFLWIGTGWPPSVTGFSGWI